MEKIRLIKNLLIISGLLVTILYVMLVLMFGKCLAWDVKLAILFLSLTYSWAFKILLYYLLVFKEKLDALHKEDK